MGGACAHRRDAGLDAGRTAARRVHRARAPAARRAVVGARSCVQGARHADPSRPAADTGGAGRGGHASRRDRRGRRSRAAEHAGIRGPRGRTVGAGGTHRSPDRRHGPRAGARARGPRGRRNCRRSRSASAVTRRRRNSRSPRCTTARRLEAADERLTLSLARRRHACLPPAGRARPRARAGRRSRRSGRSPAAARRWIARCRCRRRRKMPRTVTQPSCASTVRTLR